MRHQRLECTCRRSYCGYCEGNLFSCIICHGFEGSLPTDCPGERMSDEVQGNIYAGRIDFRSDSGWAVPDGKGSSMGDTAIRVAEYKLQKERTL